MGDRERNKKRLLELLRAAGTGNARCADCGAADPDWASYKLGVFICLHCSGVHRNFPDISRVKSVRLDFWEDGLVEFMTHNGNLRAKAKYEARVPAFYYIPQASDCLVLKEQWIRAKYERQEFMADGKNISLTGNREGFLWKRGRDNAQFLRRRFVLSAREGLLKYYTKEQLVPLITRNYLKQGFMEKTGPKQREAFKKRWFALDAQERRLLYYKNPLDAFDLGQVFLGSREQGYEVSEGLPRDVQGNRWKAGLTIVTPERRFLFACPSEKEQGEWLESFRDVLSRPLTSFHLLTASTESGPSSR
ncbi:arf-GAP with dual PH domain-containing protein 2 isoform X6 [Pipistrellus kuhlii]|uniref:arf-GAP with dual PH domain-containing protein 2 isoform X6 n=1 Tax=Pipistrellus kuhlii TaxID=59472 RepID=UPI001E274C2C|nr:arf-GAP with dual PH domain-containing protein 2 isoform X6 [Pipistrellus kuhlii]